ncbi:MAG: hypothetical protein ACYTGZ_05300 [Planctomycetota bacterium]|jgi:hypothetical protein
MLAFDEARRAVDEHIGPHLVIRDELSQETRFGWVFRVTTRRCAESGDIKDVPLGLCMYLVEGESGRILEIASCFTIEQYLAIYEAGLHFDSYDLTISDVRDMYLTVELLRRLPLTFVIPEKAHGDVWRIPNAYSRLQLQLMLKDLPCVFRDQRLKGAVETFGLLDKLACCTYQLSEHVAE